MNSNFLRVQQIIIDVPSNAAEPFIHIFVQKVVRDEKGKDIQVVDRVHQVHKKLTEVFDQSVDVFDPVLGKNVVITVAGVDRFIRSETLGWMREKFGGEIVGDEIKL